MAKTKKEVEALDQDDRGDSSLAGWAEVIRQEGERSRKAERERKAKLDELPIWKTEPRRPIHWTNECCDCLISIVPGSCSPENFVRRCSSGAPTNAE